MTSRGVATLGTLAIVALHGAAAQAQLNNEPFSFRGRDSVGMSSAYRQAILLQEIDGGLPDVLYRDRSGQLAIPVRTRGNQAFLRQPASPFILTGPGEATGGFSAKFGTVTGGMGGFPLGWWGALGGGASTQTVSYAPSAAAIDIWIAQLEGIAPLR